MTEAESNEIVDSIKAIIEKAAVPISPSPPSIITTILENPKEIMDRAKYTTENSDQISVCKWLKILFLTLLYRS
jgi:hypothetical protein